MTTNTADPIVDRSLALELTMRARQGGADAIGAAATLTAAAMMSLIPMVATEAQAIELLGDVLSKSFASAGLELVKVDGDAEPLIARIERIAICNTDHPAEAVGTLLGAAGTILTRRLTPAQAVQLIIDSAAQALAITTPTAGE